MSSLPLLPDSDKPRLVGIARMASEGESIREGHNVEYFTLESKSLLNRCVSKRQMPFTWTINPYRGCEFGCKYCYARYTHEFLQPAPVTTPPIGSYDGPPQPRALAFEHEIYLKENAAWLLEQELRAIGPNLAKHHDEIALGTATDPYQ